MKEPKCSLVNGTFVRQPYRLGAHLPEASGFTRITKRGLFKLLKEADPFSQVARRVLTPAFSISSKNFGHSAHADVKEQL